MISSLIDFILHIDVHLQALIAQYGITVYGILFLIIFVETGLVIMPFLPWDSLLFAAWSFAALGSLNIWILLGSLVVAAIAWDSLNYLIGKYFGPKFTHLTIGKYQLIKPEHIKKTESFFEKYGAKAIIMARFMPIIRTCIPFVAGIGRMDYKTFMTYNIIGGIAWVIWLTWAWYVFGQSEFVKANFEKVILLIIATSIIPIIIEALRHKKSSHDISQK